MNPRSEMTIDNNNSKNKNKKYDYESIKKRGIDKLLKLAQEQGTEILKKENETLNNNLISKQVKYPPIILSKFEKNCFQKAKERQLNRLNNGIEQIAAGKIFTGIAFVPNPSEIIFTDFEIGKKYKKNIFFTNTSYSFNSFKLVELSEDLVELFTISYERMGRMSAGVSVNIEIIFSPKRNIDIHSGKNPQNFLFFSTILSYFCFIFIYLAIVRIVIFFDCCIGVLPLFSFCLYCS